MSSMFLTEEDALSIHADQIDRYGGAHGVRDAGLLSAAVAMPSSSFGGVSLHADVFVQAAAYLFHIAQNHPFVDGNKRAGIAAALVFLDLHGVEVEVSEDDLVNLVLAVAQGQRDKAQIAAFFRAHLVP